MQAKEIFNNMTIAMSSILTMGSFAAVIMSQLIIAIALACVGGLLYSVCWISMKADEDECSE